MRAMCSVVVAVLVVFSGCGAKSSVAEEKSAIVTLLRSSYGGSSAGMVIDPVVVRTKYGVADWVQGDMGGRALVQKESGEWKVLTTAGGEMRNAEFLVKAGMPELEAKALANSLIAAERQIPEERLAKFDSYVAQAR